MVKTEGPGAIAVLRGQFLPTTPKCPLAGPPQAEIVAPMQMGWRQGDFPKCS